MKLSNVVRLSILYCVVVCLISCSDVYFKESQPMGIDPIDHIPDVLKGKFVDMDGDSLLINDHLIVFDDVKITLGDTIQLKKFQDYYFFNTYDRDMTGWNTMIVQKKADDVIEIWNISDLTEEKIKQISSIVHVEHLPEDRIMINPTKSQLIQMIEAGIFNDQIFKSNLSID